MNITKISLFILFILFFTTPASADYITIGFAGDGADYTCDGVADDVQINAAFDEAELNTESDTIFLYGGNYSIIAPCYFSSDNYGLTLTGESDAIITIPDEVVTSSSSPLYDKHFIKFTSANNIIVHGFEMNGNQHDDETDPDYLDGGADNQYGIRGDTLNPNLITFQTCSNVIVHDMELHNNGCDMLLFNVGTTYAEVYNCTIYSTGHEGIYAQSSDYLNFHDNNISFWVDGGIRLEFCDDVVIDNCDISGYAPESTGHSGIYSYTSSNTNSLNNHTYTNNKIHDLPHGAIYLMATHTSGSTLSSEAYASDVLIENNIVYNTNRKPGALFVGDNIESSFLLSAGINNTIINSNTLYNTSSNADGVFVFAWTYLGPSASQNWVSYYNISNTIINTSSAVDIVYFDSSIDSTPLHNVTVDYVYYAGSSGDEYNSDTYLIWETNNNGTAGQKFADVGNNDFHLRSMYGRWSDITSSWETDLDHSPCIDAGDPASDYSNELENVSGRVNVGAYGNTPYASFNSEYSIPSPESDDYLNITYGTITIDGDLSDWTGDSVNVYGDSNNATIYAMYDATNLYLAYNVTDEYLNATRFTDDTDVYKDDSVEMYIDTLNDDASLMQIDDYHFIVNLQGAVTDDRGTGTGKNYTYDMNLDTAIVVDGTINNSGDTDVGYIIEIAVPWSDIGGYPQSTEIGLLLAINDYDTDGIMYILNYGNVIVGNYPIPSAWENATIVESGFSITGYNPSDLYLDVFSGSKPAFNITSNLAGNVIWTVNDDVVKTESDVTYSNFIFNSSNYSDGIYEIYVNATQFGLVDYHTWIPTVETLNITAYTTPTSISIESGNDASITVSTNHIATYTWYLNGTLINTQSGYVASSLVYGDELSVGNYNISVYVTDGYNTESIIYSLEVNEDTVYDLTYIFDTDSGFGILENMYYIACYLSMGLFPYILVSLPFLAMWILSKKVIVPSILYCVIGGPLMVIMPTPLKSIAMMMFIFGSSGIVYTWFTGK